MAWVDRNKATPNSLCVFIGGLPIDVEDEELASFLRKFGRIDDLYISRTPEQGHSKGFAFATFAPGVNKGTIFGEHSFKNKPLEIKLNTHGMLCLAGLPSETTQATIVKAFDHLGFSAIEVIIGGPGIGVAEGIAFVRLEGSLSHLRALQVGNIILNGKRITISAKAPRRPSEPVPPVKNKRRTQNAIDRPSTEGDSVHPAEVSALDNQVAEPSSLSNLQIDGAKKYVGGGTPETASSFNTSGTVSTGNRLKKYSVAYQPTSLTHLSSPLLSVPALKYQENPILDPREILLASLESMTQLVPIQPFRNPGSSIASMFAAPEPIHKEIWVKFYTFPGMD
jgi:RNA recognition motif-containing protein